MKKLLNKIANMKLEHYVLFSLANVLIYSIAEFVAGCFGVNHDTLTTCFFSVFGGEVLSCALIKIFKMRENSDSEEE